MPLFKNLLRILIAYVCEKLRKCGSLYMVNFANAKITVYFAFVFIYLPGVLGVSVPGVLVLGVSM